jgi:hypothetical protein
MGGRRSLGFVFRDCSCFWGSPSNDNLGSFPKSSERLGRSSERKDLPTSPLLALACTHKSRLFGNCWLPQTTVTDCA